MAFILKTVEAVNSPVASDDEHSLYAEIVSVHFQRLDGGAAMAHIWCREPVKTAEVPGFCEVEKHVSFTGTAYVMNEGGKTVSSFTARTSGDGQSADPKSSAPSTAALGDLPYNVAAAIRRAARIADDKGLLTILDYERVAVDA